MQEPGFSLQMRGEARVVFDQRSDLLRGEHEHTVMCATFRREVRCHEPSWERIVRQEAHGGVAEVHESCGREVEYASGRWLVPRGQCGLSRVACHADDYYPVVAMVVQWAQPATRPRRVTRPCWAPPEVGRACAFREYGLQGLRARTATRKLASHGAAAAARLPLAYAHNPRSSASVARMCGLERHGASCSPCAIGTGGASFGTTAPMAIPSGKVGESPDGYEGPLAQFGKRVFHA